MNRKLPFYAPVQLADRENMVEIFDEDVSLEGTGTLSGHRKKDQSPESLKRQADKELEAKITFFRRMKHNEDEAKRKRELANRKKRGRYGSRLSKEDAPEDNEKSTRGANRMYP